MFSQAVRLAGTKSLSQPHYLALVHLFDPKSGRYAHHFYRFQGEPPFMCPDLLFSETSLTYEIEAILYQQNIVLYYI